MVNFFAKIPRSLLRGVSFDGTCLEASIHWPTDWVLLKDVGQTLLKAITLIRNNAGRRHRMPAEPPHFAAQMNRLCMAMTQSRRRKDARRQRKSVLRQMKRLLQTIGEHARRHRDLLAASEEPSGYSRAQAQRIIERMDVQLKLLPVVIKQAHERIIGERRMPNAHKVLSAYEPDVHVMVRGKAGREVEFGNTLLLCESPSGYLLDWELYRERAPSEPEQLLASLRRQNRLDIETPIRAVVTDRGFSAQRTHRHLARYGIDDAIAPRRVDALAERLKDPDFVRLQHRRASTEGRIGTLKKRWHAGVLRAKGFEHRARSVGWSIIGHNLWQIAQMLAQQEALSRSQAA